MPANAERRRSPEVRLAERRGERPPALFARLEVLRRIVVTRPRVERRRITSQLIVEPKRGAAERTELGFAYEEDVFQPGDPAADNLAALATAQVALNYGLFSREIVLEGLLDATDLEFLTGAARNTAAEIYVHRIAADNPFLDSRITSQPFVPQRNYLRAQIVADMARPVLHAPGDARRHAVLSSGGKESLLTYGILRQLGVETHPIFVNESGRHWFTALNAYRWFQARVPETSRVWTSADRVFNFMLRQLKFVRQDFARIRSDQYPIRLWTVAVFVFGALPILAARRAGRLLLGDEYDTTQIGKRKGVVHYHGLFDQSLYFDQLLTRFFRDKGLAIEETSLLRQCSELLVEKVLAERFPELLALQVSCHATHVEGDRVRPCGACEKCRRVVVMARALGFEPRVLGYTGEQVERILERLAEHPIHQETPAVEHAAHLLARRGELAGETIGGVRPARRPEVLSLRIDAARSPLTAIPVDLRRPVIEFLAEHAAGIVRPAGKRWVKADLERELGAVGEEPEVTPESAARRRRERSPSPLPAAAPAKSPLLPGSRSRPATRAAGRSQLAPPAPPAPPAADLADILVAHLTWEEARDRFRAAEIALLPVGSTEQHGPHLPLDTDSFDAEYLAIEAAQRVSRPRPLVLPTIPYGVAYHHMDFPGTLAVSPDVLSRLVVEVGMAAARHGITKLVIVNGHGGNVPALRYAAQIVNRDARIFTCVDSGETSDAEVQELIETPNDVHSGESETSTSLATRPHLVRIDRMRRSVPSFASRYLDFTERNSVEWYGRTAGFSESGVLGDPTRASREKGEKLWAIMIHHMVAFLEDLKRLRLDELRHHRQG
jgi:creatinine amidohydrolase/Fe(II)-dependent formamide hydrolase-like protein